jgi:sugar phosphate isomerase/epimerase
MMQLGFVSAILPELSLDEVLATAANMKYDCVEVMCWPVGKAERRYAGVTHIDVAKNSPAELAQIKDLTEKHGVAISGLGYYPNPLSADKAEGSQAAEHILKIIETAAQLGINQVNSFIGRDPKKSIDENWQPFLDRWSPIVEHAEKHDVKIGIENCPMFFTDDEWPGGKNLAISPAIWRRMFADIPSQNFGLNYDPSHLIWMQMDCCKPLQEFSDRIFHVHAKDVRVDRELLNEVGIMANPLEYHSPKLPGLGEVDWGSFFSTLGDIRYQGPVCVEVEDRAYEGTLAARHLALQQCQTFLRNYIPREISSP